MIVKSNIHQRIVPLFENGATSGTQGYSADDGEYAANDDDYKE